MATTQEKTGSAAGNAESLIVVGNPVVVTGTGERVSLAGKLTAAQRRVLGDAKVESLRKSGYLQTQAEIDAAEKTRKDLEARRPAGGQINPNFGTPSMTPEAAAQHEAPKLAQGARQDESEMGDTAQGGNGNGGDWTQLSIDELGLDGPTVEALKAANLGTAGAVTDFGAKNNGLRSIEGIGEGREEEIKKALQKIAKK